MAMLRAAGFQRQKWTAGSGDRAADGSASHPYLWDDLADGSASRPYLWNNVADGWASRPYWENWIGEVVAHHLLKTGSTFPGCK